MTRPRPAPTLLAVDVGNTKVLAALWQGGVEQGRWRLDLEERSPRPAWRAALRAARALDGGAAPALVASVAPRRTAWVVAELGAAGRRVRRVGAGAPWPFAVAVQQPERVGVDRLLGAAGLVALGHTTGVVVDVGTAITIDVLDRGRFGGGLILPGFELSARALHEHTALLPRVRVSGPVPLIGTETRSALRAGIFHVTTRGVLGVVRSLAAGLGGSAPVVVTGGGGGLLAAVAPRRLRHEPDLLFWGMRLLAARQGVR